MKHSIIGHTQLCQRSTSNIGGSERMNTRKRLYRVLVIAASMCAATALAYASHTYLSFDQNPPFGSFGTIYLNTLVGRPDTSGMEPAELGWTSDPQMMAFFHKIAKRVQPLLTNPKYDYDVWMVGFFGETQGWPFTTRTMYAKLCVDEVRVKASPEKGPYAHYFDEDFPKDGFVQHQFWVGPDGADAARPIGHFGNWIFYFVVSIMGVQAARTGLTRIRARRMLTAFPVIPVEQHEPGLESRLDGSH